MKPTIGAIYSQLVKLQQVENYAEYDVEMLVKAFDIEERDANTLYLALQGDTNIRYDMINRSNDQIMDAINAACHDSFDGWSDDEIVVIKAFLADIAFAAGNQ